MSQIALMETIQNAFARFAWFVEAEIDRDTLEYLFETLRDGITDKDEFIDFVAPLISQLFEDDEDEARERSIEACGGDPKFCIQKKKVIAPLTMTR